MAEPPRRAAHIGRQGPSMLSRVLGVIGELLITAALLLAGFAFWQLYWTSYQVEGPRAQVVASFATEHAPESDGTGEVRKDDPPEFAKELAPGEVYGLVHVPSWDWMRMPLAETTTVPVLDSGWIGHYESTAQAGGIGNFSIAAHRRSYGNSFRWIDRLQPGDPVVVELDDRYLVYTVDSSEIVEADDPTNIRVIAPVIGDVTWTQAPTERWMTMTTCHPEYGDWQRYAVHLKFASWTPKSTGVPPELVGEPAE